MHTLNHRRKTVLAVAAVGVSFMAAVPTLADSPKAPTAVTTRATTIADELFTFDQLVHLSLSPTQIQQIAANLARLDSAEKTLAAHQDRALAPLSAEVGRIESAYLAGQKPDPADLARKDAALAPLKPEQSSVAKLRNDTIAAIRAVLSQPQLDVSRIDVGLPARPQPPAQGGNQAGGGANAAGGQRTAGPGGVPGAAATGPGGAPGAGGAGGGGFGGGRGFGGGGGQWNPQQMAGRMMDRIRSIPPDQYDQSANRMAGMIARIQGYQRGTPEFDAARASALNQVQQLHDMPADQYQQNRNQLVDDFVKKIQAANPNGTAGGGGFGGGPGGFGGWGGGFGGFRQAIQAALDETDNEAVRRLFLQPNAVKYFLARVSQTAGTR